MEKEKVFQHEFFNTSGVNDFKLKVAGDPPAGYPKEEIPDSYSNRCFDLSYEVRRQAFIERCLRTPGADSVKGHYVELIRINEDCEPVYTDKLLAALDYIDQRRDCSDFVMLGIIRLLYQLRDKRLCTSQLVSKAEQTILNFKYWSDEPGIDSMCYWTENHQIMFSVNEYLAGQYFPESGFPNSGMTGKEKKEKARGRILRWLELRFKTGFSEWLSHIYFDEDLTALINLIDFCDDEELVKKSLIIADLLLFDMAVNSYYGMFVSTHGRSYTEEKMSALCESTIDTAKFLFGMGLFAGKDNMSAVTLALSSKYRLPQVIFDVANDTQRSEMINRQRVAINIREAEKWGFNLNSIDDGMVLLTQQAYVHPRTINLMVRMLEAFRWWDNQFFPEFRAAKLLLKWGRYIGLTRLIATLFEKDIGRNTVEECNIYTYRTPDYMLSSAQDYKKGHGADQHHIWQATIDAEAICFTTHPGGYGNTAPTAYWTGSGFLPRVGQYKNVVFILYNLPVIGGLLLRKVLPFTHAWFPKTGYDEVKEENGWIFGRKGDGFIALYSGNGYRWQDSGEYRDNEVIAEGRKNIWICEMGSKNQNGSFEEFVTAITGSGVEIEGLRVRYFSPDQGDLQFGWKESLTQNGKPVDIKDYPRYDNPYCQASFPPETVTIRKNGSCLKLDFDKLARETEDYI